MNILFDLLHPADVNLFKNTIFNLRDAGDRVFLTYRQRGVLESIAKSEFPGFEITRLGMHRKSMVGKIFALLQREFIAFRFLRKNKINLVVCQGLACGIACKLLGVKILHYDDDSEYRLSYLLGKWFSDIDVMPDFMPASGENIFKYKGFKELAYLHPDYFTPKEGILSQYGLQPLDYVFIREISNVSLNYHSQERLLPEIIKYLNKFNLKILISLEDKTLVREYNKSCMILTEPVKDLYSLIYYSRFVISSGDTMAREACLLGNPCIYTGGRMMQANKEFIDSGIMVKKEEIADVFETIDKMLDVSFNQKVKAMMAVLIADNFEDTNTVLMSQINKLMTNK